MKITPRKRLAIIAAKIAEPDLSTVKAARKFGTDRRRVWGIWVAAGVIRPYTGPLMRQEARIAKLKSIRAGLDSLAGL